MVHSAAAEGTHADGPYDGRVSFDPPGPPDRPFGDDDPGGDDPFRSMPIFGDLARMLSQQQGLGTWSAARQFALSIATEGKAEPNVDPMERIRIEQLARAAELQVATVTGLTIPAARDALVQPVTRTQWVDRTLEDHRPLFDLLSSSLSPDEQDEEPPSDPSDPMAFMAPLMKMVGPMMLGLTAGSMVGHLAQRCFGQYDLPIPRPEGNGILLVVTNLDEFGEAWSLPGDDLRLWVCLHEITHHAVLHVPHVRERLMALLEQYLGGFRAGGGELESQLGSLDPAQMGDPDAMAGLLGDPEVLLGAIRTPEQEAMLPELEALVAVVVGYVDHTMDQIGASLLSGYGQLTEALRRRRVEASGADRFVERLFGLELTQAQYDRGRSFVSGVVERAGNDGLARLWSVAEHLPTPAEVDAPGLWLARIDLPTD